MFTLKVIVSNERVEVSVRFFVFVFCVIIYLSENPLFASLSIVGTLFLLIKILSIVLSKMPFEGG